MMEREACVGTAEKRYGCTMTTYTTCVPAKCPFYKTKAQAERDREKSFQRRYARGGPFTPFDREYLAGKAVQTPAE